MQKSVNARNGLYVRIVNFRTAAEVEQLLNSLPRRRGMHIEILDNGSEPSQMDDLRRITHDIDRVSLIRSEVNLGFGGGHNLINRCSDADPSDYIWLLNPDTVCEGSTLDRLIEEADRDGEAIYSPVIYKPTVDGRVLWFSGGSIDRLRGVVNDRQDIGTSAVIPTCFVTGAAPFMTRSTFDRLGGFNESLFLYWEDVDMSIRAEALGIPLRVVTRAELLHQEGAASKGTPGIRASAYFYMSRNRILVCREEGDRGLSLIFGRGSNAFLRLLAYSILKEGRGRLARTLAIARGGLSAVKTRGA
nr:glycosyltransferase family 2 protein [Nocardioides sp.]